MDEMFFNLPFGEPEDLSQLMRGEPRTGQQLDEPLTGCAVGCQHGHQS